jgi:protein-S-isoprenylcysteine O-methyltransferase Ste14
MATILWLIVDIFAQLIVILYPPVLAFWLVIHTNIERWRRMGKSAFWVAALAWPAIGGPLLYWRQEIFSIRWPTPWWLVALGMVALGMSIRIARAAGKTISFRTLVGIVEVEPQRNRQPLLQTGIYARSRNPVYVAHWLAIFSAAALTGFAASWLLLLLDVLALPLMVRAEERELRERYGAEYEDYMRRVPRFAGFPPW